MSYARIELNFSKYSDPGVAYLLQTVIDQVYTTPDNAKSCLVVQKGSSSAAEELLRVATYTELISSPLPSLPTDVDVFSSPSLTLAENPPGTPTTIQIGDVIRITCPLIWRQFFAAATQEDFIVNTVNSPTEVTVSSPFPAFGRVLTYEVWRGGSRILPAAIPLEYPEDGLANRNYFGLPGTEFLAEGHADSWTDYTIANNRLESLKSGASSLMNALNTADWSGTEEVVYP